MILLHNGFGGQQIAPRGQELADRNYPEIAPWILSSTKLAHRRPGHYLLAIHPGGEVVLGRDEERGRFGFLRQLETEAKIMFARRCIGQSVVIGLPDPLWRRLKVTAFQGHVARDPFRCPVLGRQQSHLPPTRLAVRRWLPLRVPYANLPVVTAARLDGGAAVGNIHRLIRINSPAVPDVGVILGQRFSRTGYANFIPCLLSTES